MLTAHKSSTNFSDGCRSVRTTVLGTDSITGIYFRLCVYDSIECHSKNHVQTTTSWKMMTKLLWFLGSQDFNPDFQEPVFKLCWKLWELIGENWVSLNIPTFVPVHSMICALQTFFWQKALFIKLENRYESMALCQTRIMSLTSEDRAWGSCLCFILGNIAS